MELHKHGINQQTLGGGSSASNAQVWVLDYCDFLSANQNNFFFPSLPGKFLHMCSPNENGFLVFFVSNL